MFARLSLLFLAATSMLSSTMAAPTVGSSVNAVSVPVARSVERSTQDDLYNIMAGLQAQIAVEIQGLDGHVDPTAAIVAVVAHIGACAQVVAAVDIETPLVSVQIAACVHVFVEIFLALVAALSQYNLIAFLAVCAQLDVALCAFIKIWVNICPGVVVALAAELTAHVAAIADIKLLLSLVAVGLGSIIPH